MAQTTEQSPWSHEGGVGSASLAKGEGLLGKWSKLEREKGEGSKDNAYGKSSGVNGFKFPMRWKKKYIIVRN